MAEKWAELEVTRACNLRCRMCLFSCNDALVDELTTDEIISLIDEFADMKIEWLKLTGGEALLRKDIFEIINHAKEKGLKVRLNSNCMLIDEDVARKVDVDLVQVSVDGLSLTNDRLRGRGTFKKTIAAIELLCEKGIKVQSNTVITQANKGELCELSDMLWNKGVCDMGYSRLINTGRCGSVYDGLSVSTAELFLIKMKLMANARLKHHHISFDGGVAYYMNVCRLSDYPFITASGDVTPCCKIRDTTRIGNVRDSSYADILADYRNKGFRAPIRCFGNCNECLNNLRID
ncbi:MAG: radical SAM protein [archaeon]